MSELESEDQRLLLLRDEKLRDAILFYAIQQYPAYMREKWEKESELMPDFEDEDDSLEETL
jgi:hypothetical protein